jgi:hypothetical protein
LLKTFRLILPLYLYRCRYPTTPGRDPSHGAPAADPVGRPDCEDGDYKPCDDGGREGGSRGIAGHDLRAGAIRAPSRDQRYQPEQVPAERSAFGILAARMTRTVAARPLPAPVSAPKVTAASHVLMASFLQLSW